MLRFIFFMYISILLEVGTMKCKFCEDKYIYSIIRKWFEKDVQPSSTLPYPLLGLWHGFQSLAWGRRWVTPHYSLQTSRTSTYLHIFRLWEETGAPEETRADGEHVTSTHREPGQQPGLNSQPSGCEASAPTSALMSRPYCYDEKYIRW